MNMNVRDGVNCNPDPRSNDICFDGQCVVSILVVFILVVFISFRCVFVRVCSYQDTTPIRHI